MTESIDAIATIGRNELDELAQSGGLKSARITQCDDAFLAEYYGHPGYNLVKHQAMYLLFIRTSNGLYAYRSPQSRRHYPRVFKGAEPALERCDDLGIQYQTVVFNND